MFSVHRACSHFHCIWMFERYSDWNKQKSLFRRIHSHSLSSDLPPHANICINLTLPETWVHELYFAIDSMEWISIHFCGALRKTDVHCIPKLATPLASKTLNLVRSSWISTKYRTLHYFDVTYSRQQVYKVKVNDVDELRRRIQSPDCMPCMGHGMNLTSVFLTRRSSSGAPA